jgi:hypothetical protein
VHALFLVSVPREVKSASAALQSEGHVMAKICRKCFDENYPGRKVERVTLGRQCAWCKAKTESVEILIKVEDDLPAAVD